MQRISDWDLQDRYHEVNAKVRTFAPEGKSWRELFLDLILDLQDEREQNTKLSRKLAEMNSR